MNSQFVKMFTCCWLSKGVMEQILDVVSNLGLDALYMDLEQEIYQVVTIKVTLVLTQNSNQFAFHETHSKHF